MKQPELGIKVAELRQSHGLTQEKLAELCEVTARTIQRVESGEVDPRTYTLSHLSRHLNYDFLEDNRMKALPWLVVLHLSSLFCIVLIPLLIWSFRKESGNPVDRHGRDVINFQITTSILLFGAALLMVLVIPGAILLLENAGLGTPGLYAILPIVGLIPLFALGIHCFIQGTANTIRVLSDRTCRYRLTIPFLK